MNADDNNYADHENYDDPGQRPKVYADTGADEDKVKPNSSKTREGVVQRLNSTLPPPPSELLPISRLAQNMPPIPMAKNECRR